MQDGLRFRYVARSSAGTRVSGEIAAASRVEAIRLLESRNIWPIAVEARAALHGSSDALVAGLLYWWHGFRLGGTNVPGILSAGTFYKDGAFMFWDVHNPERTIVVELTHETYGALVIEVEEPAKAVAVMQERLKSSVA